MKEKKIALFTGTFDPFTMGHKQIVDRALAIADEVVVGIGVNVNKHTMFPLEKRIEFINRVYADNPAVSVKSYNGLTADFAKEVGASFIVKGVRSIIDFEYEKQMADMNRRLSGIETVLLFSDEEYSAVSSSLIRELLSYGKDVSRFLPYTLD
ncbi:MAG: pantetheine-phosphate adenylyltransferase [Bacteroidaceae bacterium]|mgnify:CR=1 FL=1|nr:pantetheine-phosphate adenylyltransferase [Bacteroidaceae bacterium]